MATFLATILRWTVCLSLEFVMDSLFIVKGGEMAAKKVAILRRTVCPSLDFATDSLSVAKGGEMAAFLVAILRRTHFCDGLIVRRKSQ